MAIGVYDRLANRYLNRLYNDDDATAATAHIIKDPASNEAWVPMQEHFEALALLTIGTGITTFQIMAATDSSGSGSTEVKAHATPTTADAEGDQLYLEVSAEEVLNALADASHVAVRMKCDVNSDETTVAYFMAGKRHLGSSPQTADVIS